MRKRLVAWEWASFFVTGALGTALHFVYDLTGQSAVAAAFSAVNESTWEHMKLLFVPYFLFTPVQFAVFREPLQNFFAVKATSLLVGLALIPALFYTLTGCFGKLPDWVNIGIFFVAAAAMCLMSCRMLLGGALRGGAWQILGFALLWAGLFAFVLFTFRTPHLPLFRDPLTLGYGTAMTT